MIHNFRPFPAPLNEQGKPRLDPLLELAAWYRAQAERAGSAWVWEARLLRAEDLEAQARRAAKLVAWAAEKPDHEARPLRKAS